MLGCEIGVVVVDGKGLVVRGRKGVGGGLERGQKRVRAHMWARVRVSRNLRSLDRALPPSLTPTMKQHPNTIISALGTPSDQL